MDAVEQHILRNLMEDGRMTNKLLAQAVGLSESATLERVRRLEANGVIQGYSVRVDPASVGRGLEVVTTFILKNQSPSEVQKFTAAIARLDEVLSCYQVLGRWDFVAIIAVRDIAALQQFINEKLIGLGLIDRMESMTVLKAIKRSHPPFPLAAGD
jgi:Lrp/AsnC family transcriptional regulator, leucine-responsive regulatory protein